MRFTVVQKSVSNGLISDEEQVYVVWIFAWIFLVLAAAGIVACVLSLKTFLKMGLEDGVTISFFVLSAADLVYALSAMSMGFFSVFWALEMGSDYRQWFWVDPFGGFTIAANVSFMLYVMIMLTTLYLAIARCLCVAKPFHFKNAFTKQRSVVILSIFAVFSIGTYLPVLMQMGMDENPDSRINCTRILLWITSEREFIKVIVWATRDTSISIASQVIISTCVVVMGTILRRSSAFRNKHATGKSAAIYVVRPPKKDADSGQALETGETKSSKKDNVLVKQIILICVVYIGCNIPKVVLNIAVALEPELTIGKRYQNLSQLGVNIMTSTQMLHSCFNFIVYYTFNAKFRKCCTVFKC